MNSPEVRPTGDPEPVRTTRTGRHPAPEQRPAPPDEFTPLRAASSGEPTSGEPTSLVAAQAGGPPAGAPAPASAGASAGAGAGPDSGPGDGLSDRERRILAFERQWWKHAGAKEQAIRDNFALSATRYYQLLNALLDNPAALAAEPLLVGRLRRLRATRSRNRRR